MKNKFLLILAIVGIFVGCDDNDYDEPNTFSDVGFYSSTAQQDEMLLNIYDYITFVDVSQGEVEHTWSIGEGNFFLDGPIASRDSVFTQIYPGQTIVQDKTIHVQFNKSGNQEVRLRNLFKDSVAFRGNSYDLGDYILPSVKEGDYWVIDTTFVVKVYDTIIADIEVRQFGDVIDHTSLDTVYVEAGDVVQFIDKTTIGEPTGRYWSVRKTLAEGAVASDDDVVASSGNQTADLVFKKLGNFTARITANRSGQNIPADSDTYIIPAPFKVVPSSKPFVLTGTIKELENETIQVPFNGEFASFLNKEAFFKVILDDNGTPTELAIESVTINSTDSTILDIVLAEPIYRPDVLTVTLLEGSGIESTDTRTPVSFADEPVIMHDVNLLNDELFGFEDGGGSWWAKHWSANGTVEFTTEMAYEGDYSIKLGLVPGQKEAAISTPTSGTYQFPEIKNITGEKFVVSWEMYITPDSDTAGKAMGLFRFPSWAQTWVSLANKPKGEWVTVTGEYSASNVTGLYLRILDNNLNTNVTVYYDNFKLQEKEERP
ncbi:hypothetical protein SAMN05444411_103100 [Lutibacter oricola]|uniref:Uncharacterized protein n=1 Tax=Lutibacter oricola TaxID=762486 RepID=A0A1H2Z0P2_9FLAO|nr:hypothetical protein [Lutibacter oricola]SDX10369.1 hypothetical protein SAMN05444411_103100 [Lutibacter oricola]